MPYSRESIIIFLKRASVLLFLGALCVFAITFATVPKRFFRATILPSDAAMSADSVCPQRTFYGVCLGNGAVPSPAVAVMVEHHPAARPQAGLSHARVVYEMPVEGQYTRFLAIFDAGDAVSRIGPVRSARPYAVSVAEEYGAIPYMHVGGSADALEQLTHSTLVDVNEFYAGELFWRDDSRYAPHNVYTGSEMWSKVSSTAIRTGSGWVFGNMPACIASCAEHVSFVYADTFRPEWRFTSSTGRYMRFESGEPHRDEERQIAADTVIVQFVSSTVLDSVGRLAIDTFGTGTAWILRDGYKIDVVWHRDSLSPRTRWQTVDGKDVQLKPGTIWVQMVNEWVRTSV
jgi:hypothetical protein